MVRKSTSALRPFVDAAVYVAVRAAIALVQALPLASCQRISSVLAAVLYDVIRLRRQVIDDNLRHAYPELPSAERERIARDMWRHLVLMSCEVAHVPRKLHQTNWRQIATIPRIEQLVRLVQADRPLVFISAHFGNFELAGYLLGLFGFPSHTIARPLDNPYLDRFVNRFRGHTGQRMVAKDGSGDEISEVLRNNGIVGLLGDQAAGRKGCWAPFFSRPASTHKAVAVLPLGANAPLVISFAQRLRGPLQYELVLQGVADPIEPGFEHRNVPSLVQWYNENLEIAIHRAPEQYWWVHRRWKGTPPTASEARPHAA